MCVFLEFFDVWFMLGIFFCWGFSEIIMNKCIKVFYISSFYFFLSSKWYVSLGSKISSICICVFKRFYFSLISLC